MGAGALVNLRIYMIPLDREIELQTLLLSDEIAKVELEAFLGDAVQTFFRFRCKDANPEVDVDVRIE